MNEEEQLMLVEANLNFDEFLIQVCEREVSLLHRSQILYKKFDDIFTLHKQKPWLNESSNQCYVCEKKIGLQKTHWYASLSIQLILWILRAQGLCSQVETIPS